MVNPKVKFDIAGVERETGIGKDALRVWEKRYGFPVPERDEREERLYPQEQVERLRLIKRLLDSGMRPVKVVGLAMPELNALLNQTANDGSQQNEALLGFIDLIKGHQAAALRVALGRALIYQGMEEFLSKTITPLNELVGEAWMRGEMRVFEEHLYSEQVKHILHDVIAMIRSSGDTPRVLLTTLPGEEHTLGLLMAEATLSLCGVNCTMLGVQTPIQEIVLAAKAHRVDVVVLSFSSAIPAIQVKSGLEQARAALPTKVALWAGGAGVARQRNPMEGVQLMGPLSNLTEAVIAWREAQPAPAKSIR
jgi:DNA-binding transcriptional MerR regulator/methylmalonyl-CoA mutase cobalamin-binding subunit